MMVPSRSSGPAIRSRSGWIERTGDIVRDADDQIRAVLASPDLVDDFPGERAGANDERAGGKQAPRVERGGACERQHQQEPGRHQHVARDTIGSDPIGERTE